MKRKFTLSKKLVLLISVILSVNSFAQSIFKIDAKLQPELKHISKEGDLKIAFDKALSTDYKIVYVDSTDMREKELPINNTKDTITVSKNILDKQRIVLTLKIYKKNKLANEFSIPLEVAKKQNPNPIKTEAGTENLKEKDRIKIDQPTGYAFVDAKLLMEAIKMKKKDKIKEILVKYEVKYEDTNGLNDFLKENNSLKNELSENATNASSAGVNFSMLSASSIGGLDVTKYANAMADIMIEHAKEELTVAFFNRFKRFIDKHDEFKVLFPKTTEKMSNLLGYKYPEMIKALRVAFLDDIKHLDAHIDDVLALPKYKELSNKYPEIVLAIRSLKLAYQIESGNLNASGALQQMALFSDWDSKAKLSNMGKAVKVANLINESISMEEQKDGKTILVWVDSKELSELYKDANLFNLYLGLLYEKGKDIKFNDGISFADKLANQKDNIFFFQNKIQEFIDLTDKVRKIQAEINIKKPSGNITNEDRYNYMETSIDIVEYALSMYNFFDKENVTDDYVSMLHLSNTIYKNIYQQDYNAAVSNVLDLFQKIRELQKIKPAFEDEKKSKEEAITLVDNNKKLDTKSKRRLKRVIRGKNFWELRFIGEKAIQAALIAEKTINDSINGISGNANRVADSVKLKTINKLIFYNKEIKSDELNKFIQKAKPFALFMANMVEAKTEADVKAALDAVILPVGSSSIKKHSNFNFNVQSYLGARYTITRPKNKLENTWNEKYGVSAPIGLSVSYGLNKGGSVSLFAPLLDLGAIVDYKLTTDTDTNNNTVKSKDYTIKLGQIFSPGAYVVYGLPFNIPLSVGIGGQYGPGLGKIKNDGTTLVSNPDWKWNVFLAVDIPLFNFVNHSKNK